MSTEHIQVIGKFYACQKSIGALLLQILSSTVCATQKLIFPLTAITELCPTNHPAARGSSRFTGKRSNSLTENSISPDAASATPRHPTAARRHSDSETNFSRFTPIEPAKNSSATSTASSPATSGTHCPGPGPGNSPSASRLKVSVISNTNLVVSYIMYPPCDVASRP